MSDLINCTIETLREDDEFFVSRACSGDGAPTRLLVSPCLERPAPASVARLEQAYALRGELDGSWAARPVELVLHEGNLALLLQDPGGDFLESLLGQPMEVPKFLPLAIGIAKALGNLHGRGLVHKDLKPSNVIVNTSTGEAWLTGFGLASRLPHHRPSPQAPEVIAGTLAYMAPEQTGRMNRSIDSRSDLYSLGVTLYEMLVGSLPFAAADPMEWIHCHIARTPASPKSRNDEIPDLLSAIVMKLLSKAAEERYQTAAGVEADLRKCLASLEARGWIEVFPLGAHDVADRFLIPEKLYGRENEIALLLAAFDRVVTNGATGIVLVSGYSGVGKSSLVNELHGALVRPRGLFASGKFDQFKRDIPYATIAQAFQKLVRQILAQSEAEVHCWRAALQDALVPNGQLIVNLIPEIEAIIGKQPPVPDLPPQDTKIRFQMVFRRFIAVFAHPEHPLALFLDDLQWLDAATLALVEYLVAEPEVRNLLLVGAYRDNEVDPVHPLMRTLELLRKSAARVDDIVLSPLRLDDLGRLISDALHDEPEDTRPLAELVHEKTSGNPFFAIQFIMALADERLIAFNPATRAWTWDVARIRAKGFTDNVVELMVGKLSRLPSVTLEALKQFACLGNNAHDETLGKVLGLSMENMEAALWEALRAGLVVRTDGAYAFLHDRVQEAAYAFIPDSERPSAHLRIGKVLMAQTAPAGLDENAFEIVNHLNRGAALIHSPAEREELARINLLAGKRAKAATAFAAALSYFTTGVALLSEDGWERCHALVFALSLQRAECQYLTGALASAQEGLAMLFRRAGSLAQSSAVTCLRVDLYTNLDQAGRAIEIGLEYLRSVGVPWSVHPTDAEVEQEFERIWQQLGSRSIEDLVALPAMTDPDGKATLDVLTAVHAPANFLDGNLLALVIGRLVNLSLEHGNGDGSCLAYVFLGMILEFRFGDYRAGFRFGKLGVDLVEQGGLDRFKARVLCNFGNAINPWTRHVGASSRLLRDAFETAQETGDLTFMAYSFTNRITALLAAGDPLSDVQREAETGLAMVQRAQFGTVVGMFLGQIGLIQALRGLTPDLSSFEHAALDECRFEEHLEEPGLAMVACWYWIRKLQARVFAGERSSAIIARSKASALLWTSPGFFVLAEYHFYGALAWAAQYHDAPASEQPRCLEALAAHQQQLEIWAENGPANFLNRAALVAAEIARIEGRALDAMHLYEKAALSAHEHRFAQNEGLANELAAKFYAERGFETIAEIYFRHARNCYLRWGADGKVRQLDQMHRRRRENQTPVHGPPTIGTRIERLDFAAIAKTSQAVSGEIVLSKLNEKLMKIAVEHVGAQRGSLVLLCNDEPKIEAQATTGRDDVEVTVRQVAVTPAELPESILHYVIRTRETVVLDDASVTNLYSEDEYVRRKRPRSVLCLPIVKQTKVVGALYLENNLTPGAFTSDRVAVLDLLASQAAISLENARLYAELEQENLERKQAEGELRRSEGLLAEGQRISRTGSWAWNLQTGAIDWSAEQRRIFGVLPDAGDLTFADFVEAIHPEDRPFALRTIDDAIRVRGPFDHEFRIVLPDGGITYIHGSGRPVAQESGEVYEYIGAIVDITERKRAEAELRRSEADLRKAQAELAHVTRVTTMGELAASIAHEVNQPIAGVVLNGNACLRWLARVNEESPNLAQARETLQRIIRDGNRAGEIIARIRALFKKTESAKEPLDLREAIGEMIALARSEMDKQRVALHLELPSDLPPVLGDRVQLQQVMLNLTLNAIESMAAVEDRARDLVIQARTCDEGEVLVTVRDSGVGLDPVSMEQVFTAFHTTKPAGLGMGLSISRSIVENHSGRLWATAHDGPGASFHFTLLAASRAGR